MHKIENYKMNKYNKQSFDLKDKYESASDSPKFLKPDLNESSDKPSSSKIKEKSPEKKNEGIIVIYEINLYYAESIFEYRKKKKPTRIQMN